MLSYKSFVDRLLKSGLRWVYISIHGSNRDVHNRITRSNSFDQTLEGIKNVSQHKDLRLIVNYVIVKENLTDLNNIFDTLKDYNIDKIKFSLVEPINDAKNIITPDIKEAAEKVKDAVDYANSIGVRVGIDGFPLCIIKEYKHLVDNLKTNKILYISEVYEDRFYKVDKGNKTKITICERCNLSQECEGIYPEYINRYRNIICK